MSINCIGRYLTGGKWVCYIQINTDEGIVPVTISSKEYSKLRKALKMPE